MEYAISDISGDTLDTFGDQRAAVAGMLGMIERAPVSASQLFLLAYTDAGEPVGDAIRGDEILARKVRWEIRFSQGNAIIHPVKKDSPTDSPIDASATAVAPDSNPVLA